MIQKKINPNGKQVSWEINENIIHETIAWSRKNPEILKKEITEMHKNFPYFYLVLSPENPSCQKDLLCPRCGNIIVFANDIVCVNCLTLFNAHRSSKLAYIGQLPSLVGFAKDANLGEKKAIVSGRPFLKRVHREIRKGKPQLKRWFATKKNINGDYQIYFSPVILCLYPNNWPRSEPAICMEEDYFSLLFGNYNYSLSDFHAYSHNGKLLKLCNYRSWRTVSLATVLQQRIVPKTIIDLMIADLIEVGRLNEVIRSLGTCLHNLYNHIGQGNNSERFKDLYNRFVSL